MTVQRGAPAVKIVIAAVTTGCWWVLGKLGDVGNHRDEVGTEKAKDNAVDTPV